MTQVDNNQDIIDSRDLVEYRDELSDELDTCPHCGEGWLLPDNPGTVECPDCEQKVDLTSEMEELNSLNSFIDELEGYGDFDHGEPIIRYSYFDEYTQQLAEDCGLFNENQNWPNNHIDWESAADELKTDYTCADFDGVEYWMRA